MPGEPSSSQDSRRLEFSEGSSHKFWNIDLEGSKHTVAFGRIGTAGQSQTKEFDSDGAARKSFDKLVAEKLKKGYVDASGTPSRPSPSKAVPSPTSPSAESTSTAAPSNESSSPTSSNTESTSPPAPSATPRSAKSSQPKSVPAAADGPPAARLGLDTQPSPAADVDLSTSRELDLSPDDWARASFRAIPPRECPAPAPFNLFECLQRVSKIRTLTYGHAVYIQWDDLKLPPVVSPAEAHFWLVAMTRNGKVLATKDSFREYLASQEFHGNLTADAIQAIIRSNSLPKSASILIAALLSPVEHLRFLNQLLSHGDHHRSSRSLVDGFMQYVLPYLPEIDRQALRQHILADWDPHQAAGPHYYSMFPVQYYVAAALGMHEQAQEVVSHWADNSFHDAWKDTYQCPQDIVFGLSSAEVVAAEWRRLKLRFRSGRDVRAFLACTEYSSLECIADAIVAATSKEACEDLLKALVLVRAPEAAEPMLQCRLAARAPAMARAWLDKNVGRAVMGLIKTVGRRDKLADAAIDYFRGVKQRGLAAVIVEAMQHSTDSDAVARLQAEVLDHEVKTYPPLDAQSTPSWLSAELAAVGKIKRKSLPAWADAAMLPPLLVGDAQMNAEQVAVILQVLAATPVTEKHPLLVALRHHLPKSVRDDFAWKVFESWKEDGCVSKDKWAMGTIGHLGDDRCVMKLTPFIRVWPGESQHVRAVFGLECLRAIGSSTALMQLAGIAQKMKFKGLKAKAEQFVTEIAAERGLTRDELEDRVVPDCGLDENGRREFSFGPRVFKFVLGGDLKPMVRDEHGKLRPNLPDPGAKDDQETAAESVAEWKLLKKQIKDVAATQAGRLEQAMVTGRRWTWDDFTTLLVRHPLLTHLVQKLVWAGYDARGERVTTFRVTEERDFASSEDDSVDLAGVEFIGLVHPLELTSEEKSRWGEVLSDYEIIAPFPQLGRAIATLEPSEEKDDALVRFHGMKLPAPSLVFTLEKLGWVRGGIYDAGGFNEHSKQFRAADVTAVIEYDGMVGVGYIDANEFLTVTSIHFCAGMRAPAGYGDGEGKKLLLRNVSPIVLSEVLVDMQALKSKAK